MNKNTKVWYESWDGKRLPAIVTGKGKKNGQVVYDLKVENVPEIERNRWAYADQLELRT